MNQKNSAVLNQPIFGNIQVQSSNTTFGVINHLQRQLMIPGQGSQFPIAHVSSYESFYVSFRLAGLLPAATQWGAYISNAQISQETQDLISNGCPSADAPRIAQNLISASINFQYLLDCELVHLHEFFFICGLGLQPNFIFDQMMSASNHAALIGRSFAAAKIMEEFGDQSAQVTAMFNTIKSPPCYQRGDFSSFSRLVFEDTLTKFGLRFSSPSAMETFLKNIPIYTDVGRALPGLSLGVSYF